MMESIDLKTFNLKGMTILYVVCSLTFALSALGQSGGDYDLSWHTIDGGGGVSSGGPYTLTGTIGQPDAAYSAGGSYKLFGGFWAIGCFPSDHPDYTNWNDVGRPSCWCYPRQCHGDTDGRPQGKKKDKWVSTWDAEVFRAALGMRWEDMKGKTVYDVDPNCSPDVCDILLICADADHLAQGKKKDIRVSTRDVAIFRAYLGAPDIEPNCP